MKLLNSKYFQFFFTLITVPLCLIWMILLFTVMLMIKPFLCYANWNSFTRMGLKVCSYILCIQIFSHHHPNYNPNQLSIYCQNHISFLDPFITTFGLPGNLTGIVNEQQLRIPIYGWILSALKAITVNPTQSGNSVNLIEATQDRLTKNLSIVACPEAHRSLTGDIAPFKSGLFHLAKSLQTPIVPVVIRGLYAVNHKGSWLIKPGRVDIFIGPQIDFTAYQGEQLTNRIESLQRSMSEYLKLGIWQFDEQSKF